MTTEFDPNWPHGHVTRSGLPARIYATDGAEPFPIHGAIKTACGWSEIPRRYDGRCNAMCIDPADVINAPAPVVRNVRWIGISRLDAGSNYRDRSDVGSHYVQHLYLTFENDRCVEVKIFDKDQADE